MTPFEYIDSHAHLTMDALVTDLHGLLERSKNQGVGHVVNIIMGPDPDIVEKSLDLCRKFPDISVALGIHPHDAQKFNDETFANMKKWSSDSHVKVIGEIGLDYHYEHSPKREQMTCFESQIAMAHDLNKPIAVHTRNAYEDTLHVLKKRSLKAKKNVVIHCFTGLMEEAKDYLDLGAYISFSGIITFKKSEELRRIVAFVPMDRIVIETDSPFLAPEPFRGKQNEPSYLRRVAETIAMVKGLSLEQVAMKTRQNTINAFDLEF